MNALSKVRNIGAAALIAASPEVASAADNSVELERQDVSARVHATISAGLNYTSEPQVGLNFFNLTSLLKKNNFQLFNLFQVKQLTEEQPSDPLAIAEIQWVPTDYFTLKAGRVFGFTPYTWQPPPNKNTEMTYPVFEHNYPIFDYGIFTEIIKPIIEVRAGIFSGRGLVSSEVNPDLAAGLTLKPLPELKLGVAAQGSLNPDNPYYTQFGFADLDFGSVQFVAEVSATKDTDLHTAGSFLTKITPVEEFDVYSRQDFVESSGFSNISGINFRPSDGVMLRAAVIDPQNLPDGKSEFRSAIQFTY
jgi:hypothetical protein